MTTTPISAMLPDAGQPSPSSKVEGAAKQFEALMIAQMLRGVREENEDQDSTASVMQDVADQQFSQVLANNGGLGLASLVVKGLNHANQQQSIPE